MAKLIFAERAFNGLWGLFGLGYVWRKIPQTNPSSVRLAKHQLNLKEDYHKLLFSGFCLQKLIDDHSFETVLHIGSGDGTHSAILQDHGKAVTQIDYGKSVYYRRHSEKVQSHRGGYLEYSFDQQFDAIWASHVLEHQPNPNLFLKKTFNDLKTVGILAITLPPLKHAVVGGHVTLWNSGLLLYQLALDGFDCRHASILSYGYNISVIVEKKPFRLRELSYDSGDIALLGPYLPKGCDRDGFDGNIQWLDW